MTAGGSRAPVRSRARSPPGRWPSPISIMTASSTFSWSRTSIPRTKLGPPSSRLYLGNGDLTFREATASSGIPADVSGLGAVAADLNGDRVPDIFVSGTRRTQADPEGPGTYGRARLLVNDGRGPLPRGRLVRLHDEVGGLERRIGRASPPATSTPTGGRTSWSARTRIPAWRPSGPSRSTSISTTALTPPGCRASAT